MRMRKNKIPILSILVFSILLYGCLSRQDGYEPDNMINSHEEPKDLSNSLEISEVEKKYLLNNDILLSIKEGSISRPLPDFITLVYENTSDTIHYGYSPHFLLEKRIENTWYSFYNATAPDVILCLQPSACNEVKAYIKYAGHFSLDESLYRFVVFVHAIEYLGNGGYNFSNSSLWTEGIVIVEFKIQS